jgi:hypothetical protein
LGKELIPNQIKLRAGFNLPGIEESNAHLRNLKPFIIKKGRRSFPQKDRIWADCYFHKRGKTVREIDIARNCC